MHFPGIMSHEQKDEEHENETEKEKRPSCESF